MNPKSIIARLCHNLYLINTEDAREKKKKKKKTLAHSLLPFKSHTKVLIVLLPKLHDSSPIPKLKAHFYPIYATKLYQNPLKGRHLKAEIPSHHRQRSGLLRDQLIEA